jgi:hypothetical protein
MSDYGELIAAVCNLRPGPCGANGYDAVAPDGSLLCLKIDLNGDWTKVYYRDFALVKQVSRYRRSTTNTWLKP